ncbi:VanZ family protein [Actinomadura barringtoniae]|uniref:VanZ family protein n=1 Tax=Actinomadura barringtoniae TaxID=1427535 RepID=A0A939PMD9_9ACTN|nr:VanZ family protein [Actinomadura barringtoniae]
MDTQVEMNQPGTAVGMPRWFITGLRVLAVLAALAFLAAFSYVAYKITLTPVHDHGQAGGNTDPGKSLRFYLDRPTKETIVQVGGNLMLLAPLGILLPVVSTRLRGPLRLALVSGLISLTIETAQGLSVDGRAFDIDDVILNTAGVVIAYLFVGRKVSRLVRGRD